MKAHVRVNPENQWLDIHIHPETFQLILTAIMHTNQRQFSTDEVIDLTLFADEVSKAVAAFKGNEDGLGRINLK